MRRLAVITLLLVGATRAAVAHPGQPGSRGLNVQPGDADHMVITSTVGTFITTDGGATWRWVCETAVPYGATFMPDFEVAPTGVLYATSFSGLRHTSDHGCVFEGSADLGLAFASTVTSASDGTILVGLSEAGDETVTPPVPADRKVYRSIDGGATFTSVTLGSGNESWISLEAAPSDPSRVYLSGYRLTGGSDKTLLLFRSDDGGQTYDPLPLTAFDTTMRSDLEIAAIAPNDPDHVLVRVTWWMGTIGDAFYVTRNGGATWTKVVEIADAARAAVIRASGEMVIASVGSGIYRGAPGSNTVTMVSGALPQFVYCMTERAGELWVCTDHNDAPPFDWNIMRTTDLVTWTPVMRLREALGPVECGAGTVQYDCCTCHSAACTADASQTWEWLAGTIGNPNEVDCSSDNMMSPDAGPPEDPPDTCCGIGPASGRGTALLALLVALALGRRRRRAR